jgi:hypothetical protein
LKILYEYANVNAINNSQTNCKVNRNNNSQTKSKKPPPGVSDDLHVPQASMPTASPMTIFMVILAMVWAFMFLFSRNAKANNEKPARINPDDDADGDGRDNHGDGGIM